MMTEREERIDRLVQMLDKSGKKLGKNRYKDAEYLVLDGKVYEVNQEDVIEHGDYFQFMEENRTNGNFVAYDETGDIPLDKRQFKVEDGTEDLLGGAVEYGNTYISIYPAVVGKVMVDELAVNESVQARYNLSGSKGTYRIRRVF
jgi:hypothetical protein